MGFLEQLIQLQRVAGLSDAAFEKAIDKGGNYLGRVKKGKLPIPDEETARKMAEVLRGRGADITPEALWALAAVDKVDPEVRAYYEARIAEERAARDRRTTTGVALTRDEAALIATMRELHVPGDVAALLDEYLMLLKSLALHAPLEVVLRQLFDLPLQLPEQLAAHAVRTAAEHNANLLEAWDAATGDPDSRAG